MGDKYWCDLCSVKKVEVCPKTKKRKIGLKFWSTNITRDYIKHLETPKHIKNEDLDKEKSIYCKFCDTYFPPDGYIVHEQRNKEMWKFKTILPNAEYECNEFIKDGHRYSTFEELKNGEDHRARLRRKKEQKNKSKEQIINEYKENGCVIIGEDSESEEFVDMNPIFDDDYCDDCSKMVFFSQHTNSEKLTKGDKNWLHYNNRNHWCNCCPSEETVIELNYPE